MRRIGRPSPSMVVALAALVVAIGGTAYATGEGKPLIGGARNPGSDTSTALKKETQIIASLSGYGTRQSNKSSKGGGAIYGCRSGAGGSATGNNPCIRANNLSTGSAFELVTAGNQAGRIETKDASGVPFTTNATGVATGLNADRVDGKEAADLVSRSELVPVPLKRTTATAGGTLADAEAAAPEILLASKGQLSVYAKCFANATIVAGEIYARTTADGAVMITQDGIGDLTGNGTPFLNAATPEATRVLVNVAAEAVPDGSRTASDVENAFQTLAPDGSTISGNLDALALQASFSGGAWGSGNACWFGGTLLTGP